MPDRAVRRRAASPATVWLWLVQRLQIRSTYTVGALAG